MAEVLFRAGIVGHETLADVDVRSAGLAAREDDSASDEAISVMREMGHDLTGHRSRRLTPTLGRSAQLVLAMTQEHVVRVRRVCGERAPVATLGDYAGTGESVDDPFMGERAEYREVAAQIARLVSAAIERFETGQAS